LADLDVWLKQLNAVLEMEVPKILLGNKSDLRPVLSDSEDDLIKKYCQ